MRIERHAATGLWVREDGAVYLPISGVHPAHWAHGSLNHYGYLCVRYKGKLYLVHRLVAETYIGPAPTDKPEVDHINRIKVDNSPGNLRYADRSLNNTNKDYVDRSIEKYGVRSCENRKAYQRAQYAEMKAKGLRRCKGPTGKWGWFPRIRS